MLNTRNKFLRIVIALVIGFGPAIISSLIRKKVISRLNQKQRMVLQIVTVILILGFIVYLFI